MSLTDRTLEKKADVKNGIVRMMFVGIALILEIILITGLAISRLHLYAEWIAVVSRVVAVFLVLGIYSQYKTPSIKIPWIILILVIPVVGILLYIMIGLSGATRKMRRRFEEIDRELFPHLQQDEGVMDRLREEYPSCCGMSEYLLKQAGYPVYQDTKVEYYDNAMDGLEAQKQALREAKHFIFMEYFAIEDARAWNSVQTILEEKVREGLDVRVFYDDIGSIGFINTDFVDRLQDKGIPCRVFNPVTPIVNLFLNNRDHRKMTIVDGRIGFTGGYNMADEYFNLTSPYGHWKDTGIRLEGKAVRSMTITFLEMWNAVRGDDWNDKVFESYLPEHNESAVRVGYIQPYSDNPMDKKQVGEDLYISMINRAQKYFYIMSPYLIITDEMSHAFCLAAKRGVDVRIITPGIPDKKIVFKMTRSYYSRLVRDGVRIFEYTPGFSHGKMCVSDDMAAICGTINLDYRSLYHHFEDGCLMIGCDAVISIKNDFIDTFQLCEEVTEKYLPDRPVFMRFTQLILRLFAPLV